ncbi:APC family permease [Calidifontibacter terrae]
MRSDKLGETLLPKRLALPIFASDALSSVAYAPDEILLTLGLAGGAFAGTHSWQIALAVVFVMAVVVASYRQNVRAYPSGGGDYEVATVNIGPKAGLTVASALLVDYTLTVAVSVSSGVQNAKAALPFLAGHEVFAAVAIIVAITAMNLRGIRESGSVFAIPVYLFMLGVIALAVVGFARKMGGDLPLAESAQYDLAPAQGMDALGQIALMFLLLRAFSSGCAALTGVEAISNGVPSFRKPKSQNAATTLLLMGSIAVFMMLSIVTLANWTGVRMEDPSEPGRLTLNGQLVTGYHEAPVLSQLAHSVFAGFPAGVVYVSIVTGLILVLAANTAFNGFPVLASILARDGFLPRQLQNRGDRLAFSNGIVMLSAAAIFLVVLYDAQVTRLIQLYIVGVFVSFTLSQTGMIRHWNTRLHSTTEPVEGTERRQMHRSRVINLVGALMAGLVLVIVLLTKFVHGAGYAVAAMVVLFAIMLAIRKHYAHVAAELALPEDVDVTDEDLRMLPSRVHAIVLVSKLHKPTMRALAYARATRPSTLEAVTVAIDEQETAALRAEWDRREIPVRLKVVASPFREIVRPVVQHVKSIRRDSPRDVVMVYIPEYVVGRWWEQFLHNQSALRLKAVLHFTPGVMVASVPWQLRSSERHEEFVPNPTPPKEPR